MLEYLHASREASFEATVISNFNYFTIMEEQNVEQVQVKKTSLFYPSLFGGRFTRLQFWLYAVIGFLIALGAGYVCVQNRGLGDLLLLWVVLPLFVFYFLIIQGKRAHDLGCSYVTPLVINIIFFNPVSIALFIFTEVMLMDYGSASSYGGGSPDTMTYALKAIIVVVEAIPLLYLAWLGCSDSQKGTNKYGPSLKYPDEEKGESPQA